VTAIGFTETQALINRQIDVAMTFTDNEPVQAAALGYPVDVMKVSKYAKLTPNGLVTSTSMVKNHASVVRSFVNATLRGQAYTLQHPDAAFKIALKRMPEIVNQKDIDIQRKVLAARLAYQAPVKGKPLGWSDPASWKATANFLLSIGAIQNGPAAVGLFTNRFVNRVNLHLKK
jgi:NitT/TauT family transport system substrate-binding protein